jgi:hypothetical protein
MIHRYKLEAAQELLAAVQYYEAQKAGLGGAFLDEVDAAIATIKDAPARWPAIEDEFRRYRLDRFPYMLVYETKHDALVILAVAHLHQRPGYWRERLK